MGHRYANIFMQCCADEQNYIKCDIWPTLGQYKLAIWVMCDKEGGDAFN